MSVHRAAGGRRVAHQIKHVDAVLVDDKKHLIELELGQYDDLIAEKHAHMSDEGEAVDVTEGQETQCRLGGPSGLVPSSILGRRRLNYVADHIMMGNQDTFLWLTLSAVIRTHRWRTNLGRRTKSEVLTGSPEVPLEKQMKATCRTPWPGSHCSLGKGGSRRPSSMSCPTLTKPSTGL